MIFSRFVKPESEPQGDFPKEIPQYEIQVEVTKDKQVIKKLVESEETLKVYDQIQADNHGLDVYDLIKRFNAGDTNIHIGVFDWEDGDFTGTTMSLVEMQSLIDNQRAQFENAPLALRQHYDSDFTKFLNGLESGEYAKWVAEQSKFVAASASDDKEEA